MSQKEITIEPQNGQNQPQRPDPEVAVGPSRRQFSRVYKLRILAEVEQCRRGEIGALLRREGLYSSTLSRWRQQKAAGKLDGRYDRPVVSPNAVSKSSSSEVWTTSQPE